MSIYTLTGLSKEQWIRDDPNTPANRKTFDLGNGKKRHIISSRPLHYWTEVGKGEHPDKEEWDDIDTTLRLEAVGGKEYSSHFIADKNNFSTGYRTDGSSYKFAGFRLNEANQYETTLHAVYLDGVEIPIPETLIITQAEQNVLEHAISESVKIWNVVHPRYVRDAIKTTQYVQDFRIVYKVHLSGFTILNSHTIVDGVNEYQPNTKGDFVLQSDASAGEKIVTIPKPIMWTDDVDSLNRFCSEINHRLYEQDGVLYYEKAPNSLGRDWLLANKPTLYIDGTAYYGDPSNDAIIQASGTSWDAIHDATTATVTTNNSSGLLGTSYSKGTYRIYRQCYEFDTSGIADDATITAASLYLKCASAIYASTVLNVFQGFQATPPTGEDYDAFGSTSFGKSSGDWADGTYKSIALNSSGISAINKTGTTKLFFRDDYDLNDVPPSGVSNIAIYMADQSGTDSDPYLDVSTGAGGAYVDLAGSLNTTSQLTASLKRYIGMAGSANFTFSAENTLKATRKVQGTLETSGSLDGTTKVARGISGLINAKADMSLAIGFMVNLSGIIEAGGDAAGQIKIVKDISGNVLSTSSLAGVVKSFRGMDGNILIPSSLNGTSKATRNLIGASETVSDLAASLKPIRGISGVIDSRAEVAGFTSIFKTIIGAITAKADISAALELFGTIEFSGSISTKGEMASNLRLNLSLSGEVTTAPSLKGNIRIFKTLSGALETVASIVGDAMRIQGFSGDIASATSIEGYLVRDRILSGAITSSIDVNGKVKIILYFSGSMDSLASLIASLSTFIPSTLGNPIDVSIVSVSTQRELYSITIKRTLTEV